MADIIPVSSNVKAVDPANITYGLGGEAISLAGRAVYKSSTTGKYMLADNNSATLEARAATGIALNQVGSDGQPLAVQTQGDINFGSAILTAGASYWLSDTAGGICPDGDVGAGENACFIGIARTTQILALCFFRAWDHALIGII